MLVGRQIRKFITARLAMRGMRASEAGQWWSKSPRALVQLNIRCVGTASLPDAYFALAQRTTRQRLIWTPAPSDLPDRLKTASDGERTPIGLPTNPAPGLFLIGLPDFDPNEAGRASYRQMFAELEAKRARLRQARAIIIDLRYNDGGADEWSLETAKALWGPQARRSGESELAKSSANLVASEPQQYCLRQGAGDAARETGKIFRHGGGNELRKAAKAMQAASVGGSAVRDSFRQ